MAGVPKCFLSRVDMQRLCCRVHNPAFEGDGSEDRPSDKPSDHCRGLQRGTATGYGSRVKTLTGLGSDHQGGGSLFVKCL